MKIVDLLKAERISLNLKARNKEEAISELAAFLKNAQEVVDYDLFVKNVFERENLNTTGMGNSVAIPHARTDAVNDFVFVFGRAAQGVEFNSVDNAPARLIFLLGTPVNKGVNSYLKILARLTRILSSDDFRELLMNASGPEEIIRAFQRFEH
ncbi:MAG: PTS sugar transporter subunit IIA [Candidatus Omnitrophica bacterium]|nr:PTS sugar transporter subunit IIA [Candidatus Omnitrophota bacterium]